MSALDIMVVVGPALIIVADLIIYMLVGKLGKTSSGKGNKYQPFTGGEQDIAPRGLYQSELFAFAALFMIVEAFALLLAGSFTAPTNFYPLLFLIGGSGVILLVTWWLMTVGGLEF
jgi:hypothetical protein